MVSEKQFNEAMQQIFLRFDQHDQLFGLIFKKFDQIDDRFIRMEQRFDQMDQRFDRMDQRFDRLEKTVNDNYQELKSFNAKMDERVTNLEQWRNSYR